MDIRNAAALLFFASTAAASADNSGAWTEQDVKKACHYRAESQNNPPAYYERCMKRSATSVGKPKKPGEAAELDKADRRLDEKVAARAAAKEAEDPAK